MSKDTDGLGPKWFEVFTSGGTVREYRPELVQRLSGDESVLRADGDPVRWVWLLAKESDRSGNTVAYSYRRDLADVGGVTDGSVSFQPDKISYSTVDGTARRFVKFAYETTARPDREFLWSAGVSQHLSHRLMSVEMHGPNPQSTSLLWKYNLGYGQGVQSKRSVLTSVQQCGALGTCTWSKTFKYASDQPQFSTPVVQESGILLSRQSTPGVMPHAVQTGDFNGDGADDYLYTQGSDVLTLDNFVWMSRRNADGSITAAADRYQVAPSRLLTESRPVDVDGDGIDELVAPTQYVVTTGSNDVLRWNAGTHVFEVGGSTGLFAGSRLSETADFADIDGDSRLDLVEREKGTPDRPESKYRYRKNTGTEFEASSTELAETFCQPFYADLEGDGRMDLVAGARGGSTRGCSSGDWVKASQKDDGTIESVVEPFDGKYPVQGHHGDPAIPAERELVPGDFNGDGLQDAALVEWLDSPRIDIRYNTGNGFTPAKRFTVLPAWPVGDMVPGRDGGNRGMRVADMDQDGKSDFVIFHEQAIGAMPAWNGPSASGGGVTVLYGAGGYANMPGVANPAWLHSGVERVRGDFSLSQLGDFNNDGRPDFMTYRGDGTAGNSALVRVTNSSGTAAAGQDVLVEVGDSANTRWPRQKIEYSTEWTDQKDITTAVAFPLQSMRRHGLLVVRKVTSFEHLLDPANQAAITNGGRVTEYRYNDPVFDVQGRGFLGFGSTSVWDPQRPSETVTEFDNTTRFDRGQSRHDYPFAGRPKTVTTVTGKLTQAGAAAHPDKSGVRVSRTVTTWERRSTFATLAYTVQPKQTLLPDYSSEVKVWEEEAAVDWALNASANPTATPRTHFYAIDVPANADRRTRTAGENDLYGNATRQQSQTTGGATSDVTTTFDMSDARKDAWLVHLPLESVTTKIEADDTPLVPHRATSKLAYEHDPAGRLTKTYAEKNAADVDLRETTTNSYLPGGQ
ncbi:FG-GAP repeat domain-containing protein, partial [Streptomyces sp. NPDC002306]